MFLRLLCLFTAHPTIFANTFFATQPSQSTSGKVASNVPSRWVLFVRAERTNNTHASHNNSLASWVSWQIVDLNQFFVNWQFIYVHSMICEHDEMFVQPACMDTRRLCRPKCLSENSIVSPQSEKSKPTIEAEMNLKKRLKQNYGSTHKVSSSTQFRLYCGPGRCQ